MDILKNIETNDKDEKECLGFLTMDKTKWETKEKNDEYSLTYCSIPMNNPLTNAPEEIMAFCLEVTLNKPIDTVIKYLNDFNIRKSYDTQYNEGKIISEKKEENLETYEIYLLLKMGFVFSNRDFVVKKKIWKDYRGNKNHYLIYTASIDHPDYPEKSNPVRGVYLNRAAYLYPGKNDQETTMLLCNCMDMKMINIATFMTINKGCEGITKWFGKLKDALNKN